jgi:hypothetical protein
VQTSAFPEANGEPAADSEAVIKAREAVRKKMRELEAQPTAPAATPGFAGSVPAAQPVTAPPKPAVSGKKSGFIPLEAPPLPISLEKQQRLADLLQQYKADAITPEQYHRERARILAEP